MAQGDHLVVRHGLYTHHGIDAGDGTVIHLSGEPLRRRGAKVERTSRTVFARGNPVEVLESPAASENGAVLERARSQLGRQGYNLLFDNCEHFARWCLAGRHESVQVDRWARVGCATGTLMATAGRWMVRRGSVPLAGRVLGRCLGPAGVAVTVASVAVAAASSINRFRRSEEDR